MKLIPWITLSAFFALFLFSCSSFQAERVNADDDEMLSTKWNENDARMTAEKMISRMLRDRWITSFKKTSKKKKPIIIIGEIDNKTDEPYLDTDLITEELSTELINSGEVSFLDASQRKAIMKEMKYQRSGAVRESQIKKLGRQKGADFLLFGNISSVTQERGGRMIRFYLVTLRLTNLETSEIVWQRKHKIKKKFKQSGSKL